jgi:tRNA(Ile)-lysidine synthase TilS/MesJ
MNSDETFTRVRIRKTIIPMLAEINPRIVETLARTADLLQHLERKPGAAPQESGTTIDAGELKVLPRSELYAELRAWLRSNRGSLRSVHLKHIEAIERLLSSRKSGKTVELPGGGRVVKEGGRLVFSNIKVEK